LERQSLKDPCSAVQIKISFFIHKRLLSIKLSDSQVTFHSSVSEKQVIQDTSSRNKKNILLYSQQWGMVALTAKFRWLKDQDYCLQSGDSSLEDIDTVRLWIEIVSLW